MVKIFEFDGDVTPESQYENIGVDEQGAKTGAQYPLMTDGGMEDFHEFYVETSNGERVRVTEEDYKAASWVGEENWLVEDRDNYVEFGDIFVRELENYLENNDEAAEKVIAYSAAAGNMVSEYYDRKEWMMAADDVRSKFRDASDKFSAREGGLINWFSQFAGLFNPKSGHGAMNPYHKESDICRDTIEAAAHTGFAISEDLNRNLVTVGSKISCQDCIDTLEGE